MSNTLIVKFSNPAADFTAFKVHPEACRFEHNDNLFIAMNEVGKPLQCEKLKGDWTFLGFSHEIDEVRWNAVTCKAIAEKFGTLTEYAQFLLRTNEVYNTNPYGDKKPAVPDCSIQEWLSGGAEVYNARLISWEAAKARTGKWMILYQLKQ